MSQSARNSISKSLPKVKLPAGHVFFPDCPRENWALFIRWAMSRKGIVSWFATHTFKDEERINTADKMFRIWTGRLTQSLRDAGGGQLRWIRATEWQIREVIHFHAIVQGIGLDSLSRKAWEHRWESLHWNTGFCRIHDADPKAAPYLAKYTSKRLGGELQWGGYWQGLSAPASLSCGHSLRPFFSGESRPSITVG